MKEINKKLDVEGETNEANEDEKANLATVTTLMNPEIVMKVS